MLTRPVIIVDDHSLARDELKYQLTTFHPDVEIIGEFEDPQSAWPLIASGKVEGIFLDINFEQHGGNSGMTLARRVSLLAPTPWIIFVTGYPEHALDAHDFRPFGFITKPIDDRKLEKVLNNVRTNLPITQRTERIEVKHKIIRMDAQGHIERLFQTTFLRFEEIAYIHTEGGCLNLKLSNGEELKDINGTLGNWITDYDFPCFLQVHKASVVNLKQVSGFMPDPTRVERYLLTFKNISDILRVGPHYFAAFKEAIKKCA